MEQQHWTDHWIDQWGTALAVVGVATVAWLLLEHAWADALAAGVAFAAAARIGAMSAKASSGDG